MEILNNNSINYIKKKIEINKNNKQKHATGGILPQF